MSKAFDPISRLEYYHRCLECEGHCKGHPPTHRDLTAQAFTTVAALLSNAGSLRLLMLQYWRGGLIPEHERLIESEIGPDTRFGYKPSDYSPQFEIMFAEERRT